MEGKKKRKGKKNFKKRATSWFKCHAGVEQGEKWKYSFNLASGKSLEPIKSNLGSNAD